MILDERFDEVEAPIREALEAQRALLHALARLSAPGWMEIDLSTGQLKALVTLDLREGMTVGEVAEALHVGKPAASMLVDRLVQQGYVERSEDPSDRRRAIVVPSAAGAALVEQLRQGGGGSSLMLRLIQQLSAGDLAALTQGLRALSAVAEREAREATRARANDSERADAATAGDHSTR